MSHWAMVIELGKCIGCETCRFVCAEMNDPPGGGAWRRVIDPGPEATPDRQRIFLPIGCMHCEKPPCLSVCPTGATHKYPDGIVDIDFGKCIGCGACVVACPYSARYISDQDGIHPEGKDRSMPASRKLMDRIGVSSKCTFCRSVIDKGCASGLKPGIDPAASPYCVRYCLGEALHFGDLDDSDSEVSTLIRKNPTVQLQAELGTHPTVFYILEGTCREIDNK